MDFKTSLLLPFMVSLSAQSSRDFDINRKHLPIIRRRAPLQAQVQKQDTSRLIARPEIQEAKLEQRFPSPKLPKRVKTNDLHSPRFLAADLKLPKKSFRRP